MGILAGVIWGGLAGLLMIGVERGDTVKHSRDFVLPEGHKPTSKAVRDPYDYDGQEPRKRIVPAVNTACKHGIDPCPECHKGGNENENAQ